MHLAVLYAIIITSSLMQVQSIADDLPGIVTSWRGDDIHLKIPKNYPPNEPLFVLSIFTSNSIVQPFKPCSLNELLSRTRQKPKLSAHNFQGFGEHLLGINSPYENKSPFSDIRNDKGSYNAFDGKIKSTVLQSDMFGLPKEVRPLFRLQIDEKEQLLKLSLKRRFKIKDYVTYTDPKIEFGIFVYDGCYDNEEKFQRGTKQILIRVNLNIIEPFICSRFSQDMCLLPDNEIQLQMKENQNPSLLFQPPSLLTLCPDVRRRTILSGNDHVMKELYVSPYSSALNTKTRLDREQTDSLINFTVKCEIEGAEDVTWKTLSGSLRVLDEDDSTPIRQKSRQVMWSLWQNLEHLDDKLMIIDPDVRLSGNLEVSIIGDTGDLDVWVNSVSEFTVEKEICANLSRGLPTSTNASCTVITPNLSIENPYKQTEPSTVKFSVVLTDKSPLLINNVGSNQVEYEVTVLLGKANQSFDEDILAIEKPVPLPPNFVNDIVVKRAIQNFLRLTQVYDSSSYLEHHFSVYQANFSLQLISQEKGISITPYLGILYVSDHNLLSWHLEENDGIINALINWGDKFLKSVTIRASGEEIKCPDQKTNFPHVTSDDDGPAFCAKHFTEELCISTCGLGAKFGRCAWRNNTGAFKSTQYATCSPNLSFCPDGVCDELELINSKLCPQDCIEKNHVKGQNIELNNAVDPPKGIAKGFGVCSCDDFCQCFPTVVEYLPEYGEWEPETTDTEKDTCDLTCMITLTVCGFSILFTIFFFVLRRYHLHYLKVKKRDFFGHALNSVYEEERSSYVDGPSFRENTINVPSHLRISQISSSPSNHTELFNQHEPPNEVASASISTIPSVDPRWEFPRNKLFIENIIGGGEFGRVAKGKALSLPNKQGYSTVAVKMLKENNTESELLDLLSEYDLLKQVSHPNVIQLLGACTQADGPLCVIIEYCKFGSLRSYLRQSRNIGCSSSFDTELVLVECENSKITTNELLSFAWQICKGMTYLANMKLVHRDLAARNVLLAEEKVCKISDFGLTRDIYEADLYFKKSRGRVPVKWMAIESLSDQIYTSRSDVWSFGVLLWELVTLGSSPYPGVTLERLFALLKAGHRMEKPVNCSDSLYDVMKSCWLENAFARPSFPELKAIFENMMKDSSQYLELNSLLVSNRSYFEDFCEDGETNENKIESSDNPGASTVDGDSYLLPKTTRLSSLSSRSNFACGERSNCAETTFTKRPKDNITEQGKNSSNLDLTGVSSETSLQYSCVLSVDYEDDKETFSGKIEEGNSMPSSEHGAKEIELTQDNLVYNNKKNSSSSSSPNNSRLKNSSKLSNHFHETQSGENPVSRVNNRSPLLSFSPVSQHVTQIKKTHESSDIITKGNSKGKPVKLPSKNQKPRRSPVVV